MHVDVAISGLIDVAVTVSADSEDADETTARLAGLSLDDMCTRARDTAVDTFKSAATLAAAIEQATATVDESGE